MQDTRPQTIEEAKERYVEDDWYLVHDLESDIERLLEEGAYPDFESDMSPVAAVKGRPEFEGARLFF